MIEPFAFRGGLLLGTRTAVACTVSSGDFPFQMTWLKDGKRLERLQDVEVNRGSNYSIGLMFNSLTQEHQGNYTCLVENDAGFASYSSIMMVFGK